MEGNVTLHQLNAQIVRALSRCALGAFTHMSVTSSVFPIPAGTDQLYK